MQGYGTQARTDPNQRHRMLPRRRGRQSTQPSDPSQRSAAIRQPTHIDQTSERIAGQVQEYQHHPGEAAERCAHCGGPIYPQPPAKTGGLWILR